MRPTLLLALFAIPIACAAIPRTAAAQRDHRFREHGRVVVVPDGRGYRDRIFIPAHRYKEPQVRYRGRETRPLYRGRQDYRDRYDRRDRYDSRDRHGYGDRYGSRYRRRINLVDLLLGATGRSNDPYRYRRGRCRRGGGRIIL